MAIDKEHIRAEHEAAMSSLTPDQVQAFKRISRSYRESLFRNCSAKDMLETVFEEEAAERSAG